MVPLSTVLAIANFAVGLAEKIPALVKAGIDVTDLVANHRAKVDSLAKAGVPPAQEDWDELNRALDAKEKAIQSAHRDAPGS